MIRKSCINQIFFAKHAKMFCFLLFQHVLGTHEVVLTSGDLLFYESMKVFHGRPHKFKGSWYSSVFVHYYPKYGWEKVDHTLEKVCALPSSKHSSLIHANANLNYSFLFCSTTESQRIGISNQQLSMRYR